MGAWVPLPISNAGVAVPGRVEESNPATTDLTVIMDLRRFRLIRMRSRYTIDYAATTRYLWTWQSYLDQEGTFQVDNGNNISGRGDIIDTGASGGISPGLIVFPNGMWGPGTFHAGGVALQNEIYAYHGKLPGPFAKMIRYLSGTPATGLVGSALFEGYIE